MERGGEEREAKSAIVKSQPHPKPTRSVQTLLTVQIPCGEDDPPAFRGLTRESAGVGVGRPDLVKRKYHCTYCRCSALPQPMGIRRNANPSGGMHCLTHSDCWMHDRHGMACNRTGGYTFILLFTDD